MHHICSQSSTELLERLAVALPWQVTAEYMLLFDQIGLEHLKKQCMHFMACYLTQLSQVQADELISHLNAESTKPLRSLSAEGARPLSNPTTISHGAKLLGNLGAFDIAPLSSLSAEGAEPLVNLGAKGAEWLSNLGTEAAEAPSH